MSTIAKARGGAVLAATAAVLLGAFAAAPQADASVIYACVKKSGAARIVSRTAKCKKGESKLSWNTEGPAGRNGSNGANGNNGTNGAAGTNGTNGAVAGYSATQAGSVAVTEEEVLVLSKTLPAGSYLVSAKAETRAVSTSAGFVAVRCELWDQSAKLELDESEWAGGVAEFESGHFGAAAALPLQAAVSSTSSIEVQVWCETTANGAKAGAGVNGTQLSAVQTSANS